MAAAAWQVGSFAPCLGTKGLEAKKYHTLSIQARVNDPEEGGFQT
jgi:hypothetical protein